MLVEISEEDAWQESSRQRRQHGRESSRQTRETSIFGDVDAALMS